MAFEVPSHLKASSSSANHSASQSAVDKVQVSQAGSEHITSLLKPLVGEDWTKLTSREVVGHRQRLELDAQNTKNEVLKLISGNYVSVTSQLNGSLDSQRRTAQLQSKLAALEREVDGKDQTQSLVPPLIKALLTHSSLSHRLLLAQNQLSLSQLLQTYRQTFSPLVGSPPPPPLESVQVWKECTALLARPEWDWSSSTSAGLQPLKLDLIQQLRVVRDRVEEELGVMWDGVVSLTWTESEGMGVVSIKQPPGGVSTQQLVKALQDLGTLADRTQKLLGSLNSGLIRPFLRSTATEKHASFAQSSSSDGSLNILHLSVGRKEPTDQQKWQTSTTILPALESLLAFLSMSLPPLPSASSPDPRDLNTLLTPSLIPLVISDHLTPSLRSMTLPSLLPDFLSKAHSFAEWETTSSGNRSKELTSFACRVGSTWVKWRRADVLASAREIVGGENEEERNDSWLSRGEGSGWESWVWERETIVQPPVKKTSLALDIKETDDWTLDDAPPVASLDHIHSELQPAAPTPPPLQVDTLEPTEDVDADDAWGFDDDTPPSPPPPPPPPPPSPPPPADEELDAWGFSGSDDDAAPIRLSKAQPRQAKRLGKTKQKVLGQDVTASTPAPSSPSVSLTSSLSGVLDDAASLAGSRTSSPAPVKKGAMKLGKRASQAVLSSTVPEPVTPVEEADVLPEEPVEVGPRVIVDRLKLSERVKSLFDLGKAVGRDVEDLTSLSIDRDLSSSSLSSPPSSILQKTISDIFSLFRALLPVAHQSTLSANPALAMLAVNDCEWLAEQVKTLLGAEDGTAECLKGTGTKWFDDELARRQTAAYAILDGAYRFVDVGDEQRGSDCESAVVDVLARIEELSSAWKSVLSMEKTFIALGSVLNSVLARMLKDITDLDDITTAESQRLNEILKLVHPVEQLFAEAPGAPSLVVGFVPLWLKFCYLSELLEASMADITYLFESGALIDFDPAELARLVRALFSDNSLRAKTIDLILAGHPAAST